MYEFKVTNDNTLYLNGELNIPKGGNYTFKTSSKDIAGKDFSNKVTWSIENNPDAANIKISSSGKLTVSSYAYIPEGRVINVVAQSANAPETGSATIKVPVTLRNAKATKIEFVKVEDGRMSSSKSAVLFTVDAEFSDDDYDPNADYT